MRRLTPEEDPEQVYGPPIPWWKLDLDGDGKPDNGFALIAVIFLPLALAAAICIGAVMFGPPREEPAPAVLQQVPAAGLHYV